MLVFFFPVLRIPSEGRNAYCKISQSITMPKSENNRGSDSERETSYTVTFFVVRLPSAKPNPAWNPGSRSSSPLGWTFENPRDLFCLVFSMGESLHEGPQPDKAIHQQTHRSTQASPRSWEAICFACFPLPGNCGQLSCPSSGNPASLLCHLVPHGMPSESCFSQATVHSLH